MAFLGDRKKVPQVFEIDGHTDNDIDFAIPIGYLASVDDAIPRRDLIAAVSQGPRDHTGYFSVGQGAALKPAGDLTKATEGNKMSRSIGILIAFSLTGLATSAVGQQNVAQTDQQAAREVHVQFTTAFNRQDAAGLAALFSENGIRVTPQGIIQGRDAIQKDSDKRFQSRFHDLSITPLIIRTLGGSVWEAGEWIMKMGDRPVHGYFAMTLVREGNSFKIRDDSFNIAPPASPEMQPVSK